MIDEHPVSGLHLPQVLQGQIVLDPVPNGRLLTLEVIVAVCGRLGFDDPVVAHWALGLQESLGASRSDCVVLSRREAPSDSSHEPACPGRDGVYELAHDLCVGPAGSLGASLRDKTTQSLREAPRSEEHTAELP